jgi:hypothetical protein
MTHQPREWPLELEPEQIDWDAVGHKCSGVTLILLVAAFLGCFWGVSGFWGFI